MTKEPHTNFDFDAVDEEHDSCDSSAALSDSYQLLRSILEFACKPQNRNGVGLYHPAKIGNKVLVLLYDIDPTLLGVRSKDELLRRMSPAITRRNCELISAEFRAHIRANRALFALGDPKAAKTITREHNARHAQAIARHERARRQPEPFAQTPRGKESPRKNLSPVVPKAARRSRAVKNEGRSHATPTFFDELGLQ